MTLSLTIETTALVTERIRLFVLSNGSDAPLPGYLPGAHLDFDLGELGLRSYSLVDFTPISATPTHYRIAVQLEAEGEGGSRFMHGLRVGDTLKASEPKNEFQLASGNAPVLLIAGGIGLTPILSFATALAQKSADYQLHYATRTADLTAFRHELTAQHGDRLHLWHDDNQIADLSAIIGQASRDSHIYVCGPKGMIETVKRIAEDAGFAASQVHFELFSTRRKQEGDTAFEVELQSSGQVFVIPPGKTIIEVLEENDVDLVYDCQRGDCGICQTDIIEGIPDHRDVVLSDAERAEGKVMQICVSRAKSNRLVLDL